MKKALQKNLQDKLFAVSRAVLTQYKPRIVAITGSVGKTSTKDAIATVLEAKHRVRASHGNYNNEIGVPLTILDEQSPGRSIFGWWKLLRRGHVLANSTDREYPEVLVLEMAMDRPGDMVKLVELARPHVSVVTDVSESHLEFFPSVDAIAKEKSEVVRALDQSGVAVLNADNSWTRDMAKLHKGKTITFGLGDDADVRGIEIAPTTQLPGHAIADQELQALQKSGVPLGTAFKIAYQGQTVPVRLPRVLGRQQVYAALAAAAVGIAHGMNLVEISQALLSYIPPKGRMNLIPGIKDSMLIDDTYNASVVSTQAALDALEQISTPGRKIVALADMAELGVRTEPGHREVGQRVAQVADFAVFVGTAMKFAAEAAQEAGMSDEKHTELNDSRQVEEALQKVLQPGDILLIKGSQSQRMEHAVKALMAEPLRAPELLVRQTGLWEGKP
jgi:UDP-N-acetylmuramoyl-tripeptide--D-alanyl-D-alanine ligase